MEVGSLNIELVDIQSTDCYNSDYQTETLISGNRAVSIIIIDPVNLCKALCDKTSFISKKLSLSIVLLGIDPSQIDNMLISSDRNLFPGTHHSQQIQFFLHGDNPFLLLGTLHGLGIGLRNIILLSC